MQFNRGSKALAITLATLVSLTSINFSKAYSARRVFTNFKNLRLELAPQTSTTTGTLGDDLAKAYVDYTTIGRTYFKTKSGGNNIALKYVSYKTGERAKVKSESTFTTYDTQGYYPFEPRESADNPRGVYTRNNGFLIYTYGGAHGLSVSSKTNDSRWYSGAMEYLGYNVHGGDVPNDDFPWFSAKPQLPYSSRKLVYHPTPSNTKWDFSLVKDIDTAKNIVMKTPSGGTMTFHDYLVSVFKAGWENKTGALMRPKDFSDYNKLKNAKVWEPGKFPGGSETKMYNYIFISQLPTYYSDGIIYMERDGGAGYLTLSLPALCKLDTVDTSITTVSHTVLGEPQRKTKDDMAIYKSIDKILQEKGMQSATYVDHILTFNVSAKNLGYYKGEEQAPVIITVGDNCEILREEWASDIPMNDTITYTYVGAGGVDTTGRIVSNKTNVIKSVDFSSTNSVNITIKVREYLDRSNANSPKSSFQYTAAVGTLADKATTALSSVVLFVYNETNKLNNIVTLFDLVPLKIPSPDPITLNEDEYSVEYRYEEVLPKNTISVKLPSGYSWVNSPATFTVSVNKAATGIISSIDLINSVLNISTSGSSYTGYLQPTSTVTISRKKTSNDDPEVKRFAANGTYRDHSNATYTVAYSPSSQSARKLTCDLHEGNYTVTKKVYTIIGYEEIEIVPGVKVKKAIYGEKTVTETKTHYHSYSCYDYKSVSPSFTWTTYTKGYNVSRKVFNGTRDISEVAPVQKSSGSNPANIWFYEKITLRAGTDLKREMFNRIRNSAGAILSSTLKEVDAQYDRDIYVQTTMSIQNNTQPSKRFSLGKNKATDKFAKTAGMDVYKAGYVIIPQGQLTLNVDLTRFARPGDIATLNAILNQLDDHAYVEGDFDLGVINGRKTDRVSFNEVINDYADTFVTSKISNVSTSIIQSNITGTTAIDSNGTTINRYLQRKENGNTGGYEYNEVYRGNLQQHRATANLVINLNPNNKKFMLHPGLADGEYHLYVKTEPFTIRDSSGRNINVPSMTLYTYRFMVKGSSFDDLDIDSDYVIEDTY